MQYTDKFNQPLQVGDYVCTTKLSRVVYGKIIGLNQKSSRIQTYTKGGEGTIYNTSFNAPTMPHFNPTLPIDERRYIPAPSFESLVMGEVFLKVTKVTAHKNIGKHSELIKVPQIEERRPPNIKELNKISI